MVTGDIYDIETRLQEHDGDLSLSLNTLNGNYIVLCKDQYVMEWPRPLDDRLIKHIKRIDSHRGYNALDEIDNYNEKLEQTIEKDRLNYLESVVKYNKNQLLKEL
jgi:hypothetical protein